MKIINLTEESKVYTSNVYLILGTWNALADMNTLVDVGRDPSIIDKINNINTGVGKRRINQVVLTHNHYDHTGILPLIREAYNPNIFAFSINIEGIDHTVRSDETLRFGDRIFQIFHVSTHSSDSILLYCEEDGVLFTGDVPVSIRSTGGTYENEFVEIIKYLAHKEIKAIYPGHGKPILERCNQILIDTYINVAVS